MILSNLLENALMGTVLILMTALLRLAFKRYLPPGIWLVLWGMCLFRFVCPVRLSSIVSIYRLPYLLIQHRTATNFSEFVPDFTITSSVFPSEAVPSVGEDAIIRQIDLWTFSSAIIFAVYVIGVICFLALFLLRWIRTYRLVHMAKPVPSTDARYSLVSHSVRIRESSSFHSPATFGVIHPTIILEPNLSNDKLKYVLKHEGYHAKRKDNLWNYAIAFVQILYWWNPILWLMARMIQMDIEKVCDRAVISKMDESQRKAYAHLLISMSASCKASSFSLGFGYKRLKERILAIMKFKKATRFAILLSIVLAVTLGTVFATGAMDTPEKAKLDDSISQDISDDGGIELSSIPDADSGEDIVVALTAGETTDVEGNPDLDSNSIATANISKSVTFTLSKGKSKTISFNVNGGLNTPDHNTANVIITKEAGSSYQYISEDTTTKTELANVKYSGNAHRTLTNLKTGHTYEITIINLGTDDLKLTVAITSYLS